MCGARWPFLVLAALAILAGGILTLRHQRAEVLRTEIALARDEQRELAALRAEKRRLAAQQVSDAELARLREDRAAVLRLRAEVDTLRARTEQMERAAAVPSTEPSKPEVVEPALALKLRLDAEGHLSIENRAFDFNTLRQQMSVLRRGDRIAIGLEPPERGNPARNPLIKQYFERFHTLAREYGLKMEIRIVEPSFVIQAQQPKN